MNDNTNSKKESDNASSSQSTLVDEQFPVSPLLPPLPSVEPAVQVVASTPHQYDPREFMRGFQQLLTSNFKKIAFLAGAGASMAVKSPGKGYPLIPGIVRMTESIEKELKPPFLDAFVIIKAELKNENQLQHIENILSRVRLKAQVVGEDRLCGLNKQELQELERQICEQIREIVSPDENLIPPNFPQQLFARWISQASRDVPVEVFTTNYDYFFEIAFERESVAYFDGFIGSHQPFFHASLVEQDDLLPQNWVRLWKLHGSLGWRFDSTTNRVIRGKNADYNEIMVYPSVLKYDDSKKQPYVSFIDRLSAFLRQDDGLLITTGYSFGDQHLNEAIMNSLERTQTSNVFAFSFETIDEEHHMVQLAKREPRLTIFAPNAAVVGGIFGIWRLQREPSKLDSLQVDMYFDEDFGKVDEWNGAGKLILGDFAKLVTFLSHMYSSKTIWDRSTANV